MAKVQTPFTISAPGFYGLNIQDSPVDLNPGFALQANNCIIDKSGRIASRKGWVKSHTANSDIGTSNIECIGELIHTDGTSTILAAGGGFLFKLSGTTLVTLTYGGGGVAPTITTNNWQFCQLNGVAMFWQRGFDPLIYDPAVSTTTFRRLSERSGSAGTIYQCHVAMSAYGRVWSADNGTDRNTLVWSDLLTPHIWTGGTAGSLNLHGVWPMGGDEIVGLAAHNNFLFIFGRRQILVYSGADDPVTMKLSDSVTGIGCIARDSIQNTGEDVLFLSDSGVRSLMRTIQEKSAPLREVSKNVRDELQMHIDSEVLANIKSVYSPIHAFYLLTTPALDETYCFDTHRPLEDGTFRTTTWSGITPRALLHASNRKLYMGQAGYVGEYSGYLDDTATYRMSYFTTWIDFGNPIQTSILKKIAMTLIGGDAQSIVFKWGFDFFTQYSTISGTITDFPAPAEYGISEYGLAEYIANAAVSRVAINAGGSGKTIQFGFECEINGVAVSIQKIDIYTKEGRLG